MAKVLMPYGGGHSVRRGWFGPMAQDQFIRLISKARNGAPH